MAEEQTFFERLKNGAKKYTAGVAMILGAIGLGSMVDRTAEADEKAPEAPMAQKAEQKTVEQTAPEKETVEQETLEQAAPEKQLHLAEQDAPSIFQLLSSEDQKAFIGLIDLLQGYGVDMSSSLKDMEGHFLACNGEKKEVDVIKDASRGSYVSEAVSSTVQSQFDERWPETGRFSFNEKNSNDRFLLALFNAINALNNGRTLDENSDEFKALGRDFNTKDVQIAFNTMDNRLETMLQRGMRHMGVMAAKEGGKIDSVDLKTLLLVGQMFQAFKSSPHMEQIYDLALQSANKENGAFHVFGGYDNEEHPSFGDTLAGAAVEPEKPSVEAEKAEQKEAEATVSEKSSQEEVVVETREEVRETETTATTVSSSEEEKTISENASAEKAENAPAEKASEKQPEEKPAADLDAGLTGENLCDKLAPDLMQDLSDVYGKQNLRALVADFQKRGVDMVPTLKKMNEQYKSCKADREASNKIKESSRGTAYEETVVQTVDAEFEKKWPTRQISLDKENESDAFVSNFAEAVNNEQKGQAAYFKAVDVVHGKDPAEVAEQFYNAEQHLQDKAKAGLEQLAITMARDGNDSIEKAFKEMQRLNEVHQAFHSSKAEAIANQAYELSDQIDNSGVFSGAANFVGRAVGLVDENKTLKDALREHSDDTETKQPLAPFVQKALGGRE